MNSFPGEGKPSGSPLASSNSSAFVKVFTIGNDITDKCSPIVASKQMQLPLKGNYLEKRKRNPWTKEEDDNLISLIKAECPHQDKIAGKSIDFNKIARVLGSGRTAKQCRDRWNNFLRSGIKKGDWTSEEVELIRDMYSTFGAKWSAMAKLFHNRTENDVKNKWYSMKRKDERNKNKTFEEPLTGNAFFADMTFDVSSVPRQLDSKEGTLHSKLGGDK